MKNTLKLLYLSLIFIQLSAVPGPYQVPKKDVCKVNNFFSNDEIEKVKKAVALQMTNDDFVRADMLLDAYKAYHVAEDLALAKEDFEKVANQDKNLVLKAKAIFKLGEIYLLNGDVQEAKNNFNLVANLEINDLKLKSKANYKLGEIYLKNKESEKAAFYLNLAINQNPDKDFQSKVIKVLIIIAEADFILGETHLLEGDFDKAIHYLNLAANQNHNFNIKVKSSFLLAKIYIQHNAIKFAQAKKYILDAYQYAPGTFKKIKGQKPFKITTPEGIPNKENFIDLLNLIRKHRNELGKAIKEQIENAKNAADQDDSKNDVAKDIAKLILKY